MRVTFTVLLTVFCFVGYTQDTLYFDRLDLPSARSNAYYYQLDKYTIKENRYWVTKYHMNGSNYSKAEYIDSLLKVNDGSDMHWFSNGQVSDSGRYVNDKREGAWSFYFENGTKSGAVKFDKGEIVTEKYWDSNGADHPDIKTASRMPSFPGGLAMLYKYISQSVKYPAKAKKDDIQAKIIVGFTISETGKVEDVHVSKKTEPSLDNEAIRVVESMPEWIFGIQYNRPIRVKMAVPITFGSK